MILEIIGVIILVFVCIFIANIVEDVKRNRSKISFKEAMDLVELPIVTFNNKGQKLNFLLDTGSNMSLINESLLPNLSYEMTDEEGDTMGIDGNKLTHQYCLMDISYKSQVFNERFSILDLTDAFNVIKQEDGVQLHGILGNRFFETYKYVLDFKDLIAYTR